MAHMQGRHHCISLPGREHGANLRHFRQCQNPGHQQYLTVEQLRQKDLSDICLNKSGRAKVWKYIDRTARIVVSCTSANRPDTYIHSNTPYPCAERRGSRMWMRYGTGFLLKEHAFHYIDKEIACPCPDCKRSSKSAPESDAKSQPPNKSSYYFKIQTAAHVVFDRAEAETAVFEFFYDSEDRTGVRCLYGVTVLDEEMYRLETDRCCVLCVTHDSRLATRLCEICDFKISRNGMFQSKVGIMASHPHGVSKRISIGVHSRGKIVVLGKKSFLNLPAGVLINFFGCDDSTDLISSINDSLSGQGRQRRPVIGYDYDHTQTDGQSKTFKLLRDVTVHYAPRIVVECDSEGTCFPPMSWKTRWWRLPPVVELSTDDATRYTLPVSSGDTPSVSMEYCLKGSEVKSPLLHDNSIEKLFVYYVYDTASCPGSSGGNVIVKYFSRLPFPWFYTFTHFGSLGDRNRSGLMEDTALNCGGEDRSEWFIDDFDDHDSDDWVGFVSQRDNVGGLNPSM